MRPPHLLIAGAGIAGLTAALALGRKGVRITLVERRTAFAEVGAGLQLSPNASRILIDLGLSGALGRNAVAPERLDIRRWSQPRAFATMPMNDGSNPFGAPFWVTKRADLQTALLDAVRQLPDLRLMAGRALDHVVTTDAGVIATFTTERGATETVEADALIGADGLWSRTRSLMGDTTPSVFTGYEAWRTLVQADAAPSFMRQPAVALWMGSGKHAVHYPVAGSRLINLVVVRRAAEPRKGWSSEGDKRELQSFSKDAAHPLVDLIQAAPDWQVWSLNDRRPSAMATGKIVLIGDAAHPVLPFMAQGAALAIEDAAVLARLVVKACEAGQPVGHALNELNALRYPRARAVYATSRANARHYHMPAPLSLARDMVLRHKSPQSMRNRYSWLYGWRDDG